MYSRLLHIETTAPNSVFIFGPRGTGKTSWLKIHFPDALYFDLLDDDSYNEFLARPTRLGDRIPDGFADWVVLDEIQKVPALLNEVHRLIEHRKLRFVLTGSSARSLRSKGVNLLAGRALTYHMHPLTAQELATDFDLAKALRYGMLPSVYSYNQPKKYLKSYISAYLREEVLQEGLTRNLPLFTRFLETASFSQGEVLNYTEIAREISSNRHTVSNFFDILEDLLISVRIPVFRKRAKRSLVAHPKFYFFDTGVYRAVRPTGPLDSNEEADGPALETLFLQHARALNDYFDWEYDFFYWRTQSGTEVDFILYGPHGLHAFEIKRKRTPSQKDFKGLLAFGKDYPVASLHLLHGGRNSGHEGNVRHYPFQDAITNLEMILQPKKS